jgi:tripartite-type tricarboxylate transporter receptor subunit TctC
MNGWMKGLVAAATCAAASATFAQDVYPSKPVHLLVPFPPGGAVDVVARSLGDELAKRLGQSIIIENRPGAGGTLAAMATAKSAPDGYTLVVVASGHAIVPFLFPRLQYDVFNDFTPISLLGNSPNLLLVKADPDRVQQLAGGDRTDPGRHGAGARGDHDQAHADAAGRADCRRIRPD